MADLFPLNTKIPPGFKVPGIYTTFLQGDTGETAPNNRVLLWGYVLAGYTATLNTPFLGITQEAVDAVSGGAKSMLSHIYAAAKAQLPLGVGAEIWLMPIAEPSAGTKATHFIKFMAAPVPDPTTGKSVLGTNTAAATAVVCSIFIDEIGGAFLISQGDTFASIATKAKAMLDAIPNLEVLVTISGGDTLVITDIHAGEHGNELQTRVEFSNTDAGIAASPATLTITGPATADGTLTVFATAKSAVTSFSNTNTEAVVAGKVRDQINSDSYSVSAAIPSTATGVVTLFYRPGRPLHRLAATLSSATGLTVALAAGTAGAGTPSISSALTTLTADSNSYKAWAVFFLDTANWSSLAAHIIGQAETPIEKGQHVFACETTPVTNYATTDLAAATTPKLTSSARPKLANQQGSAVRGYKIAARLAAMVAAEGYQNRNFNGRQLVSSDSSPLGVPHRADRPTLDEMNTAIATYKRAPIWVDEDGYNAVLRASTTYKAKGSIDEKLEKWSCQLTLDYYRIELRARLAALFPEKNIKRYGKPRTKNSTSPAGVRDAVYRLMLDWDDRDLFDGAEQLRKAVQTGVLVSPTRVDVALPMRPLADLDQIAIVGVVQ